MVLPRLSSDASHVGQRIKPDPHPRIEGPRVAGDYRVWVGSYSRDEHYQYSLSVTEFTP